MSTATAEPIPAAPPPAAPTRRSAVEALAELIPDLMPGESVFLTGVTWEDYVWLSDVRAASGRRNVWLTYDRGSLEVVSHSNLHERWKAVLTRLIDALALGLSVESICCRNVTLRPPGRARGFEPDVCYYIGDVAGVTEIRELDFATDPPPHLAVEVEISRSVTARLPLYAALGVGEVWRFDGSRLTILRLTPDREYANVPTSGVFPTVPRVLIDTFLARAGSGGVGDTTLYRDLLDQLRAAPPSA